MTEERKEFEIGPGSVVKVNYQFPEHGESVKQKGVVVLHPNYPEGYVFVGEWSQVDEKNLDFLSAIAEVLPGAITGLAESWPFTEDQMAELIGTGGNVAIEKPATQVELATAGSQIRWATEDEVTRTITLE